MQLIRPERNNRFFHNRGCGMAYVQRNHKVPFSQVPPESWFLQEDLTDKIAIDIPWCLVEPDEGRYEWEHPEWEGCFQSWVDAGFKVHLKVRGMDTLGTLYNDGTPQWVFDAGAGYVDDPISLYRREGVLLNDIPPDGVAPIRYPVYWDPVYIEKAEKFIHEFGRRYNGHPAVESVSISHMGRWGEMHIAHWGPMEPWLEAGYSIETYNKTLIRFIDIFRSAFPDTQLSLSIGKPTFYKEYASWQSVMDIFDYAAGHGIILKYDGLGCSFEPGSSKWLCKTVSDIYRNNINRTKLAFENLSLPAALDDGLAHGISYWQRGGETAGLRETQLERDIPVIDKRIFSWYSSFSSEFEELSVEQQKDCLRKVARKCGYLLSLDSIAVEQELRQGKEFCTTFTWRNIGMAPCYEKFFVRLSLFDSVSGHEEWSESSSPVAGFGPEIWGAGKCITDKCQWHLSSQVLPGEYELRLAVEHCGYAREMMQLDLDGRQQNGSYTLGRITVKA